MKNDLQPLIIKAKLGVDRVIVNVSESNPRKETFVFSR